MSFLQSWNSIAPGPQGPLPSIGQPSSMPTHEISGGIASQTNSTEAKHSGREALPEVILFSHLVSFTFIFIKSIVSRNASLIMQDLFAATYSTVPVQNLGWHSGPSHSMGFGLQYPTAVVSY